ncbi:MAG TPA: poly-gamma-glutamate synthase PgsB [Myxococcota bacterium]|nr:poly-gamma-glutamate synthase PgsB [Myxococcota bacterium]
MDGILMLAALAGGLVLAGMIENFFHRRALFSIRTRIHVAGTRGKSSVTRILAAAMNHAGVHTAAKTTGTTARMITPEGKELPMFRPTGANLIEQKRVFAAAVGMGADAIVIECMALQPTLHWVAERMLVRATHAVITNARPDHLDVMGPEESDVAKTLSAIIPPNGMVFTAERRNLDIISAAAQDRKASLVAVTEEDVARITPEDMAGFSYREHPENVALALKVLSSLGIERDVAIQGMWKAHPDPGALNDYVINYFSRRIVFVNGFAANDPESSRTIWEAAVARHPQEKRVIAIFNMRQDRPARTLQMVNDTDFWNKADRVIVMGTGAYQFIKAAIRKGMDPAIFIDTSDEDVVGIFERILDNCTDSNLVIGMGNIGGYGLPLVAYFRNRSEVGG